MLRGFKNSLLSRWATRASSSASVNRSVLKSRDSSSAPSSSKRPLALRQVVQVGLFRNLILTFDKLRSEEHTSELQSLTNLVCRLLLEKKKQKPLSRKTALSMVAHMPKFGTAWPATSLPGQRVFRLPHDHNDLRAIQGSTARRGHRRAM